MQDSLVAACQDCGKKYRVPSADRTYSCKACGGVVSVDEEFEPEPEPERASARGSRRSERDEDGERPRRKRRRNTWGPAVYIVAGVAALAGVMWMTMGQSEAGSRKGEPDLAKVVTDFDGDWNEGDMDGVLSYLHPQQRDKFAAQLRVARDHRGWTAGFEPITRSTTPKDEGVTDLFKVPSEGGGDVQTGLSMHRTAKGELVVRWQFNPPNETWYVYHLELPPPDLMARLDGFDAAWNAADEDALRPFLQPDKPDKLIVAFAKAADRRNWGEIYPDLSGRETDPSADVLAKPGLTLQYKSVAKALYMTEHGEMSMTWRLQRGSDDWFLSSFNPPE